MTNPNKELALFIITYGPAKIGKTLATVRAVPDGLFIAPRGALTCARYLDWEPKVIETGPKVGITQITEAIKQAQDKFPAIIVDDFSIICDQELAACKKTHAGWSAFDVFNKRVYDLRDAARAASCHVILNMHEQAPKEVGQSDEKRWIKGCPMVPGWQLPEKLPSHADLVLRVVYDEKAIGWPYLYQSGPDPDYITGDRLAITPERFPLNLREVLKLAGCDLPRPEELTHFDPLVDEICKDLIPELATKRPKVKDLLSSWAQKLTDEDKLCPQHMRWIFSDALDRAHLTQHNNNLVSNFINNL